MFFTATRMFFTASRMCFTSLEDVLNVPDSVFDDPLAADFNAQTGYSGKKPDYFTTKEHEDFVVQYSGQKTLKI